MQDFPLTCEQCGEVSPRVRKRPAYTGPALCVPCAHITPSKELDEAYVEDLTLP